MALSLYSRLPLLFNVSLQKLRVTSWNPRFHVRLFSVSTKSAPFLKTPQIHLTTKRTFFSFFRKPSAEKLKKMDRIPEDYKLIYRNAIHRYLLSAQVFSTLSAAVACIAVLIHNGFDVNINTLTEEKPAIEIENEGFIYVTAFIILCVVLQGMVMRMPIRIYNLPQKEKYVFVFYGNIPFTKKRLACKVKEVIKIEESGMLPWRDSRYEIVKRRYIILVENWFRRPADLNIMLGYQKPPENYD